MRLGRRHSCAITHTAKRNYREHLILWKWEICHPDLAQSTPELRVVVLLSQMALRGHRGPFPSSPTPLLTVPAKNPAAPSVLFIKYTVQLCVCVCVWGGGGEGWRGVVDSQGWETHVTVALRVFVIGMACLVRLRGHSQLLGFSPATQPEPIPLGETTASSTGCRRRIIARVWETNLRSTALKTKKMSVILQFLLLFFAFCVCVSLCVCVCVDSRQRLMLKYFHILCRFFKFL